MKRLITLVAYISLAGLGVGAAYAQHHGMPAGPYQDYIDLGTLATEGQTTMGDPPHNMVGWGPTAPGTIGGGYGGIASDGGSCRPVWSPTEFDMDPDHEPWADIDLDFGPAGGTKILHVRYLDGASTDDQSYYLDPDGSNDFLGSIATGDPGENWYIQSFDVSSYTGTHTLRILATEPAGTWWDPYGQVAIDQLGIIVETSDPTVVPVAVDADPINCSGSKVVNFHYTPGDTDVRGYTVRVACDASLTFGPSDITFFEVPTGVTYQSFVTMVTAGSVYDVDYVILGGSVGIAAEADLFSVEFHGAATGTGTVSMTSAEMSALDGTPITPVVYTGTATIAVDCLPPDVPTMTGEPVWTAGSVNTVAWTDESGSGAAEYYAECSTESDFDPLFGNSGWIATQSHEFSGLADGQIYYYRVKARDALLNESASSGAVSSTQDATAPQSAASVALADVAATFDVTYTASDATSGVASVELFYRIDGGTYTSYGVFTSGTIAFDASGSGEGFYEFYTNATDNVGNVELLPGTPDAGTTVDMTAPATHLVALGPFQVDSFFDVTYVLDLEDGSGLDNVELWYKLEAGGTYTYYSDFTTNTLTFDTSGTGGDGTYYFYTIGTDNVGNREEAPVAPEGDTSTIVDTADPVLTEFVINDDDTYTNTVDVTLTCDVAGAYEMRFNNDGGTWSTWEPWAATTAWALDNVDGLRTVNAEFRDEAGNDIATLDDITLDTEFPVFTSVVINAGAAYTNVLGVELTSSVTGADEMRFQNEGGSWSAWETYNATWSWDLEGADGLKRVNAEYQDLAGNVVGGFDEITLDTSGPTFTSLVINGGDTHTNDVNVSLTSVVTEAEEMRFNNDGGSWSIWEPYNTAKDWVLGSGEGDRYVYAEYRDVALNPVGGNDFITYDVTAPGAVSATTALRGHNKVTVGWTEPGEDEVIAEVWRAMWYDTLPTTSAYPEYDDLTNNAIPSRPPSRAAALASGAWVLAGSATAGTLTLIDAGMATRGIYYYEVFVQDTAGNWSDPAGDDAYNLNYLLGDLTGAGDIPDGDVTLGDISVLGASYGELDTDGDYNNECDVGPTDDYSGEGIPDTDNVVDFDDLMIFALNWDVTVAKTLPTTGTAIARFSWVRVDETTWSLMLAEPCANLKGVNLRADVPEDAVLSLAAGDLLGQQDSRYFLQNIPRNGLDTGLALLGNDACITGKGELFRVNLAGVYEIDEILIVARTAANQELEYTLEEAGDLPDLPTTYELSAAYPNPFNPSTKIDFALPEAANVRLEVFGVNGRRIAILKNETMSAGHHTVTWLGRDDQGSLVATGVYFYRLRAGDFSQVQKMTLLK